MSQETNILQEINNHVVAFCSPSNPKILQTENFKKELSINYLNFYALKAFLLLNFLGLALGSTAYSLKLFLLNLALIGGMASTFLLTCRGHPQIYRFVNSFIITLAGPASILLSQDNIFFAMAISFLAPSIILLLFQTKVFAYTSFVLQYVFLNLLYLPIYHQILLTPTLSDLGNVSEIQFNSYNFIYLINALLLYGLNALNNNSKGATAKGTTRSTVSLKSSGKVMSRFSFKSKSLLNNIVSNLDVAQLEDNPARAKILIANARLCGELLLSQANTIVDTDPGITPQIDINLSSVKSTEFFEKVWGIASELIRKKNIFGSLSFSKKVPNFLLLDQQRITQIILNILASSIRFTDRGPISLSVSWLDNTNLADNAIFEPIPYSDEGGLVRGSRSHINLTRPENNNQVFILNTNQRRFQDSIPFEMQNSSSAAKSGTLKIVITDKGPGMSTKEAEDIFDLFPKSKNSEQPRGLNMWMTNQLCQKMSGKMKVYSRPNNGTTYVVCLKAESATAERFSESPALNSRPSSRKMKALVIDDSPYSIDAIKGYLENSQVEVIGAIRDRNKAVEVYEEELRKGKLIHVIIVNGHNSISEAQSVCERIRQFENSRDMEPCAIIFLAENYVESKVKEILDPAGNAKVNHFLKAPINFSELQKLLLTLQANLVVEPSEPFRPKKVLIVDDNTFNLQLLGRILEMNHCEYLQAENGEKAVEIYMQNWKDIVIIFMDCEMPVMNGYDATRNIRKFQQTKKIPKIKILGVTGHVSSDDICKDAGMNGTVTKPFPADDIKQIILDSLREYQES